MIIKTVTLPLYGLSQARALQEMEEFDVDYPKFIALHSSESGMEELTFESDDMNDGTWLNDVMVLNTIHYDVIFKIPTSGLSRESAENTVIRRMSYMQKKLEEILQGSAITFTLIALPFNESYVYHKYHRL